MDSLEKIAVDGRADLATLRRAVAAGRLNRAQAMKVLNDLTTIARAAVEGFAVREEIRAARAAAVREEARRITRHTSRTERIEPPPPAETKQPRWRPRSPWEPQRPGQGARPRWAG